MDYKRSDTFFVGSTLKFAITIDRKGFNMNWDYWKVTVTRGDRSIVCDRDQNTICDEDHQWYFLINTAELGTGTYKVKVEIDIPDEDFVPEKVSHEVYAQNLIKVTSL